jgi:hypothetical protein
MRREDLVRICQAVPFRPFRIVTSTGDRYDIRHPELLASSLGAVYITIPIVDTDGLIDDEVVTVIVSLIHIVKIEFLPSRQSKLPTKQSDV